ncbi:hypothetical protein D3C77_709360 [compost metagenome]
MFDALVGVVHGLVHEMAPVVRARAQPVACQAVVEPHAPVDVEGLAHVAVGQRAHHMHTGQH